MEIRVIEVETEAVEIELLRRTLEREQVHRRESFTEGGGRIVTVCASEVVDPADSA